MLPFLKSLKLKRVRPSKFIVSLINKSLNKPCYKELEFLFLLLLYAGPKTKENLYHHIIEYGRSLSMADINVMTKVLASEGLIESIWGYREDLISITNEGRRAAGIIEKKLNNLKKL